MLVGEAHTVGADESLFGLGQWGWATQVAKAAQDAAKMVTSRTLKGRVEVKDATTGAYIPGAAVSLLYGSAKSPDGAGHVQTQLTDAGGNAAFMDIISKLPGERFWYKISAPGYADRYVPADSNVIAYVGLEKGTSGSGGIGTMPLVAIIGGVLILGIAGYLVFKS